MAVIGFFTPFIQELLDFLSEGIVVAKKESGRILYSNLAAQEVVGTDGHSLQEASVYEVIAPVSGKEFRQLVEGNPWRRSEECSINRAIRDVSWQSLEVDGEQCLAVIVAPREVGGVAQKDELRLANEDLITLMANSLAHDLNNVLGVVSGTVSAFQRDLSVSDERLVRRVDLLEKSSARAIAINSELMGYARRGREQPVRCDIGEVIDGLIDTIEEVLSEDCTLLSTVEIGQGEVELKIGQFRGAVLSLALNSAEAMSDGGEVVISGEFQEPAEPTSCALDRELPPGRYYVLSVQDEGPGIPVELRGEVFKPFYSTTSRGEGGGLGLTAVERILRSHGGGARVGDTDSGTCIELYIPAPL
jgi:signal transduction histidine kinase